MSKSLFVLLSHGTFIVKISITGYKIFTCSALLALERRPVLKIFNKVRPVSFNYVHT